MKPAAVLVTLRVALSKRPVAPPDRNMEFVQIWLVPTGTHCCARADEPSGSSASKSAAVTDNAITEATLTHRATGRDSTKRPPEPTTARTCKIVSTWDRQSILLST